MTDAGGEAAANRCLEAGAADLLARPIDPRRLKEVLEKHLTSDGERENTPSDP
jgi:DNA-binding response OmpR family regulator